MVKYCGAKCKITGEFHETLSDHTYFFIPIILFCHFKILASVSSKLSELTAAAAVESAVIMTVGRGETVRGYSQNMSVGVTVTKQIHPDTRQQEESGGVRRSKLKLL